MSTPDHLVRASCVLVVASVLTGCALRPSPSAHPTSTHATTHPAPEASAASTDVEALLPVSRADLTTAIWRSTQAAATYLTYRYNETAAAYLGRLRPLVTRELYAALARAASTPGIRAQRARDHETATARAIPTKIRTIGPGSVILITATARDITTTTGHREQAENLAVTTVKNPDGTWSVADIEPANAGDEGDTSDAGTQ